ncbi:hypothetical protein WAK64_18035 [Bacillus spongiae]|uniref:DUF7683 domain-containing protein n=1 Tax=Bacillus spongiae TaxID=2683610 RepID=A0ABU8HII4_9BACI
MSREIKYQYRITKYNPDFRNDEGHYTITDEWTSAYDIGKMVNGNSLTLSEYLDVEKAYINTIMNFIQLNNIKSVRLVDLEKDNLNSTDKTSPLYDPAFHLLHLEEDIELSIDNVPIVSKMVLRELIYCQLISKDFFVHFGYDYYMYIGSNNVQSGSLDFTINNSLFVEEMISPYYIPESNVTRGIEWIRIDEEIIEGSELLKGITLEEYRGVLQLSNIHPVIGSFPIKQEYVNFFQKKIKHKIDFSKYNYSLVSND